MQQYQEWHSVTALDMAGDAARASAGRLLPHGLAVGEELIAREVEVVVPDHAMSPDINRDLGEQIGIPFQGKEGPPFTEEGTDIVDFRLASGKEDAKSVVRQSADFLYLVEHGYVGVPYSSGGSCLNY